MQSIGISQYHPVTTATVVVYTPYHSRVTLRACLAAVTYGIYIVVVGCICIALGGVAAKYIQ
jgi:hypothetical protein